MPPTSTPPPVVTLERAWRDLMQTLAVRNAGRASEAQIVLRVLRSQTRSN